MEVWIVRDDENYIQGVYSCDCFSREEVEEMWPEPDFWVSIHNVIGQE